MSNTLIKVLWISAGSLALLLGIVGIFLPLLPTTPFLLLAAACYLRGSERLYRRLLNDKWFGKYIRDFREGRGVPVRTKIFAISLLWGTIGYTSVFAVSNIMIRATLIFIAFVVSLHVATLPTQRIKPSISKIS